MILSFADGQERGPSSGERGPGSSERGPGGRDRGPGGDERGRDGGMARMNPLFAALDTNGDGVLDAQEIAQASAALAKLDRNHDGKLT
ncbi:MAG: hypothetical protein RL077_4580, partial [Verrucomicrobiota bacterium]